MARCPDENRRDSDEYNTQRPNKEQIHFKHGASSQKESSSDSDTSDDEEQYPTNSLSRNNVLTKEESRKRHCNPAKTYSRFKIANEHFRTNAKVSRADGRLKLNILEKELNSGYIAKALGAVLKKNPKDEEASVKSYNEGGVGAEKTAPAEDEMEHNSHRRIKLNIVIIIIGSRGDIQPFIRIGKILKENYGHRVRMATHPAFKDFIEKDSGLEFFSVGGNPAELMAFMVKNPGLIPNIETIKGGEIGRRRAQMYEMFEGMWRACINATDDETNSANAEMMNKQSPFVADAIIANPPSFAPPHIAEKLGIPLHMMFTFPYTPTVQFPHPLANIKTSNVEATYSNFMSYPLVEIMVWQGLGDLINRFRSKVLRLEEVSTLWAPGQLYRLRVPYTYMWSPGLIPKPKDWGSEIDVSGFVFLDLASSFDPPKPLLDFLDVGKPPVYIGFGSIVVDDPDQFTRLIFQAVKMAGVRALVSKGWGGFGSNADCPDDIFMLDNTPHDWLFPRCTAVVHHGGAGTTAIGLKCARPTMIVPFFGDQPFWGAMVSKAKAGAHKCIPYKHLTAELLAEGIRQCLTEEASTNVQKIAENIAKEGDGALNAVRSFHQSLPLRGQGSMRCDFLDNRTAVWKIKNTNVKVSALAAEILVEEKKLKWNELRLIRHYEWNDFGGPGEPLTGVWGSVVTTLTDAAKGVGSVPVEMSRSLKKREQLWEKRRRLERKAQLKKQTAVRRHLLQTSVSSSAPPSQLYGRPDLQREETTLSKLSVPTELLSEELRREATFGFKKTGGAIVRFPMNLTIAVTQGFHNAPRLYGDETVRRPPRITGFHSGLRAGRDELMYGMYDGVTGIVTQPYRGAKKAGVVGAVRGAGFGVGGFVLKHIAALTGPLAYGMKGIDAELKKKYQPTAYLRRERMVQGLVEVEALSSPDVRKANESSTTNLPEVKEQVRSRWETLSAAMAEERKLHKPGLIGEMIGKGENKEGQRVPRKPRDEANQPHSRAEKTSAEHVADVESQHERISSSHGIQQERYLRDSNPSTGDRDVSATAKSAKFPIELPPTGPPQTIPNANTRLSSPVYAMDCIAHATLGESHVPHARALNRSENVPPQAECQSAETESDQSVVETEVTDWAGPQKPGGITGRNVKPNAPIS